MDEPLTAEEWELLANAPLAAAAAVALAEPGGGEREAAAIVRAWRAAGAEAAESGLIQVLVADFDPERRERREPTRRTRRALATPDIRSEAVELCRAAVTLLDQKLPEELTAYQDFVFAIANAVAHAAGGGLLGIVNPSITIEEQSALRAVRIALQVPGR